MECGNVVIITHYATNAHNYYYANIMYT